MKWFLLLSVASAILQLTLFIPFFLMWREDCKRIGKENLAVSLKERFIAWIVFFPFWMIPVIVIIES